MNFPLLTRGTNEAVGGQSFFPIINGNNVTFSVGKVIPIYALEEEQRKGIYPDNNNESFKIDGLGEFYLMVRLDPISFKIKIVRIVSDKDINSMTVDSGLNSFIPIVRIDIDTKDIKRIGLQRDLVWKKRQKTTLGRGVFSDGNIFISPFLTEVSKGYDEVSVEKSFPASIGSTLVVSAKGVYAVSEEGSNGAGTTDVATLSIGSPSLSEYTFKPSTISFDGSNILDAPSVGDHSIAGKYPVGYIDKEYNYVRLIDGTFAANVVNGESGFSDFDSFEPDANKEFGSTKIGIKVT